MTPHESIGGSLGTDIELDSGFVYGVTADGDFQLGLKRQSGDILDISNAPTYASGSVVYIDTRNLKWLVTTGSGTLYIQKCSVDY